MLTSSTRGRKQTYRRGVNDVITQIINYCVVVVRCRGCGPPAAEMIFVTIYLLQAGVVTSKLSSFISHYEFRRVLMKLMNVEQLDLIKFIT